MPDVDLTTEILRRLAALERRVAAVVRVGCVAAVQADPYRVRVNLASEAQPVTTGWVPVVVPRAGGSLVHSPLTVGEAVLLVSPGGGEAAFAVGSLPSARFAPAAADDDDVTTYHRSPPGEVAIDVVGDVVVVGDVRIDGDLTVTGDISAGGDVSDGRGSMQAMRQTYNTHTHAVGSPPAQQM